MLLFVNLYKRIDRINSLIFLKTLKYLFALTNSFTTHIRSTLQLIEKKYCSNQTKKL